MAATGPFGQLLEQSRVVDRQHLPRRGLDIERKVGRVRTDGIEDRRQFLRLGEVGGLRGLLRIAKAGSLQHHLVRFAPRQVGKPDRSGGALECEQPVTLDPGEGGEDFRQLFAAHAFDRIPPDAVHPTHDSHLRFPSPRSIRRHRGDGARASRSPADKPSQSAMPSLRHNRGRRFVAIWAALPL